MTVVFRDHATENKYVFRGLAHQRRLTVVLEQGAHADGRRPEGPQTEGKDLQSRGSGRDVRPRDALRRVSFRLDYRLNGCRETVYLGKYGPSGLSLARAREKCIDARRAIAARISPAIEKQREKRRLKEAKSFGEFGEEWLTAAPMADSTRAMRRSIFERELLPTWRSRLLTEITPDDLRALCAGIVDRGVPATAIHVRDRSCHENLALAERRSEGLGSSSRRSRCPPILQRVASEDAERVAGNKMALNTERIVDGGLNGREALRWPG